MGQRANYIIKSGDVLDIYYHHWRANHIASDLYLGEKIFLDYVRACTMAEVLMDVGWMEGCVLADIDNKQLYFWYWEFESSTSVIEYYLQQMALKWPGWQVHHAVRRMYDLDEILQTNYISAQQHDSFREISKEQLVNDSVGEYFTAVVIIKFAGNIAVTKTGYVSAEELVIYGPEVVSLILNKPVFSLPGEDEDPLECIVIDIDAQRIIMMPTVFDLWEQMAFKWPGYSFEMGEYGYLKILRMADIDTSNLEMNEARIKESFDHITKPYETYDSSLLLKQIIAERPNESITVNANFFDSVAPKFMSENEKVPVAVNSHFSDMALPKLTFVEKWKAFVSRLFK